MKKITTLLLFASLVFAMSCNDGATTDKLADAQIEGTDRVSTTEIADKVYMVSNSESVVNWEGTKAVGGGHNGTVNVAAGKFEVKDGKLAGGKLSLDMTSISVFDLTDPGKKGDLEGHLKDTDFFNTAEFPMADLVITDASNMDAVKANLTIKGITNEITFPAKMEMVEGAVHLATELKVDRTKYEITYNSGNFFENLGDKVINDEFKITAKLSAK